MLSSFATPALALLLSSALSALAAPFFPFPAHHITSLLRRQSSSIGPYPIPDTCQTTCATTGPIYDSCLASDLNGCLVVCGEGKLDEFLGCINCLLTNDNPSSYILRNYNLASQQCNAIVAACSSRGYNYPATISLVGYDQIGSNYTRPSSTATGSSNLTTLVTRTITGISSPTTAGKNPSASASVASSVTGGAASRTRGRAWVTALISVAAVFVVAL